MVNRDYYLQKIIHRMWNGEIKVITGIRRCGKSVLLFELFFQYLLQQKVPEEQIIKIELDQRRYYRFRNPIVLCEYITKHFLKCIHYLADGARHRNTYPVFPLGGNLSRAFV